MVLVRWQDAVFGLAGLAALVPRFVRLLRRRPSDAWTGLGLSALGFIAVFGVLGLSALGFIAVFGVQAIIWKITHGAWIASPHGPGYIHWDRPLFAALLLSGKGGVLHWHPAMALGFVGLIAAALRRRVLGIGLWITVLLHLTICAAVDDWHGEWGIGNRRLCALLPLIVLGLAEVFAAVRGRVTAILLALLLTSLALGNWIFLLFGHRGSVGIFSPLNQSGWATLIHFWRPALENIAAHPLTALIDNTLFAPWFDLGREATLAQFGLIAAFLPIAVLIAGRRLGRCQRIRRSTGPVIVGALVGLQLFLLTGLRKPPEGFREVAEIAQRLEVMERDEALSAADTQLSRIAGDPSRDRSVALRAAGLHQRVHDRFGLELVPHSGHTQIPPGDIPLGDSPDKLELHEALGTELYQSTPVPGDLMRLSLGNHGGVEQHWPHAWDQRLMQPFFERLVQENDTEAIRDFFDATAKTPVLWWNCRWREASERGDWVAAAEALERLLVHNPLDVQTLDLLVGTLRRLGAEDPAAFARASEHEALARAIREWELTRLRAALESSLYERAFIEGRLNYYLSAGNQ
jgi:hypothetical protein